MYRYGVDVKVDGYVEAYCTNAMLVAINGTNDNDQFSTNDKVRSQGCRVLRGRDSGLEPKPKRRQINYHALAIVIALVEWQMVGVASGAVD